MAQWRTIRVDCEQTTSAVCVVGMELSVNLDRDAPPGCKFFSVKCSQNVLYTISPTPNETSHLSPMLLSGNTVLHIGTKRHFHPSPSYKEKLTIRFYGEKKAFIGDAQLELVPLELSLDVDADRDGVVERNNPNKASWKWGPDGHGAVVLVNCDRESYYHEKPDCQTKGHKPNQTALKDCATMVLRTSGPPNLSGGYKLTLHISQGDSECIRVYRDETEDEARITKAKMPIFIRQCVNEFPLVLSSEVLSQEVPYPGPDQELIFYVEGLRFPDKDFDGLVTINLSLVRTSRKGVPETPVFTDKVVFRVSPWIMTPNTLQPQEVFICSTSDNYQFLKGMQDLVDRSGHKLKILQEYKNRGDRWIQDELEFGYVDSPYHRFPVVLDSPRDGDLDYFPYGDLLGRDFGYVKREAQRDAVSSLDSFGNLEVSPPVTVNGKKYPLGRILIGVAFPTTTNGRNMTQVVQDFLWAQKVQEPVALYSDWLVVGHVDEFMTFVPAPDRKGFRLLLASPHAGYKIFKKLQNDGHGQAKIFEGLKDEKPVTVDKILSDDRLRLQNEYVQDCIDWNRDVLKKELGLDEEDIIDLPILFKLVTKGKQERAVAYYPDMVNMIVLGKHLGIPKPFGPKVNGRCVLEAKMCSLMEGLGLTCTFIDDFASYHKLLGEVHCGSNVRRKPFDFKWWNVEL
ncbi:protein-arginine deiminase type-2 isoform X2 [Cyprinodon tularosa]|uniref:protein-arginine deiminase type-2 isoform X2 n=1 Tax=Cyprinodon tularosa TaxID=77115 RepID=UPI0018E21A9E|nr:protein-arginine deiminase type-2 isoform X2 [Cyprinodon tularosa]